jgi:hypothetical protein
MLSTFQTMIFYLELFKYSNVPQAWMFHPTVTAPRLNQEGAKAILSRCDRVGVWEYNMLSTFQTMIFTFEYSNRRTAGVDVPSSCKSASLKSGRGRGNLVALRPCGCTP